MRVERSAWADVAWCRCDMTQLGMDQRKVNMLAREYCEEKNNANGNLDCAPSTVTVTVTDAPVLRSSM